MAFIMEQAGVKRQMVLGIMELLNQNYISVFLSFAEAITWLKKAEEFMHNKS
jgi:hypothetical protein